MQANKGKKATRRVAAFGGLYHILEIARQEKPFRKNKKILTHIERLQRRLIRTK